MPSDRALSLNTLPLHYGKRLIGSEGGSSRPAMDIPRIIRLLRQKNIPIQNAISHRRSLDQIHTAILEMRSGEVVHTLLEVP
jgi:Zn-dependent alcohol dehydrogenase